MPSKYVLYTNTVILLISIALLLGIVFYDSVVRKEPYTDRDYTGIALMAFGIIGLANILFGVWKLGVGNYAFYGTILYTLFPIAVGAYLLLKK